MKALEQFIVITPDGKETEFQAKSTLPSLTELQEIVGGTIELVKVLRQDILDRQEYTYMVINESGRLLHLPKNPKATELYHANVKRAYPESDNPAAESREAWLRELSALGVFVINLGGITDMGPICGTVLWFKNWTINALLAKGF
jgi:hypothetical protein